MPSTLSCLTRAACRKKDDLLAIICGSAHERVESLLAKTNHYFYAYNSGACKGWDPDYASIPSRYHLMPRETLYSDIPADLCLIHNCFSQNYLIVLARKLGISCLRYEHTQPTWSDSNHTKNLKQQFNLDFNVFISDFSREAWGFKDEPNAFVIRHAVDTETFKPNPEIKRHKHILTCVNDFKNRSWICGFDIHQEATRGLPTKILGKTPTLSVPATCVADLAYHYQSSLIYINTSRLSPIPCALLEGLSSGCIVISTNTGEIGYYIQHGVNGLLSNDPKELRAYCEMVLANPDKYQYLADNARKTILEKCSVERYVREWNEIFYKAANEYIFKG